MRLFKLGFFLLFVFSLLPGGADATRPGSGQLMLPKAYYRDGYEPMDEGEDEDDDVDINNDFSGDGNDEEEDFGEDDDDGGSNSGAWFYQQQHDQHDRSCVFLNKNSNRRCVSRGFELLCWFCPEHFRTQILQRLKRNETIEQYENARETLRRHHEEQRALRDLEHNARQAQLLAEAGVYQEDLLFNEALPPRIAVERNFDEGIAACLPSRKRERNGSKVNSSNSNDSAPKPPCVELLLSSDEEEQQDESMKRRQVEIKRKNKPSVVVARAARAAHRSAPVRRVQTPPAPAPQTQQRLGAAAPNALALVVPPRKQARDTSPETRMLDNLMAKTNLDVEPMMPGDGSSDEFGFYEFQQLGSM